MVSIRTILMVVLSSIILISFGSCSGGNSQNFSSVKDNIEEKFGADAFFTELVVIYNASIGYSITVMATKDPASNKMEEWTYSNGSWTQTSDVTLEIPAGYEAKDFMYQLGGAITLEKLEELIEQSKKHLANEKAIDQPKLAMATIKYPEVAEGATAKFIINLEPENGGTTFTYSYNLEGELLEMDY